MYLSKYALLPIFHEEVRFSLAWQLNVEPSKICFCHQRICYMCSFPLRKVTLIIFHLLQTPQLNLNGCRALVGTISSCLSRRGNEGLPKQTIRDLVFSSLPPGSILNPPVTSTEFDKYM